MYGQVIVLFTNRVKGHGHYRKGSDNKSPMKPSRYANLNDKLPLAISKKKRSLSQHLSVHQILRR